MPDPDAWSLPSVADGSSKPGLPFEVRSLDAMSSPVPGKAASRRTRSSSRVRAARSNRGRRPGSPTASSRSASRPTRRCRPPCWVRSSWASPSSPGRSSRNRRSRRIRRSGARCATPSRRVRSAECSRTTRARPRRSPPWPSTRWSPCTRARALRAPTGSGRPSGPGPARSARGRRSVSRGVLPRAPLTDGLQRSDELRCPPNETGARPLPPGRRAPVGPRPFTVTLLCRVSASREPSSDRSPSSPR